MFYKTKLWTVLTILGLISPHGYTAICSATTPIDTPDSRYQINGDGTVTDLQTGLMWDRCTVGTLWDGVQQTCIGTASTKNWKQANESGVDSTVGGYSDWRLPNIKELHSIMERSCFRPAINETIFPSDSGLISFHNYWSSTPHAVFQNQAWMVRVDSAYSRNDLSDKDSKHEVKLVRGGH